MATLTRHILNNNLVAALVAFGCVMLAFVGLPGEIAAAVIIAFVTMRKGWQSGAIVLAFVALPAVGFLLHKELSPFDAVFLQCLFIYFFAGLLGQYDSWRLVLQMMIVIGLVLIAALHLCVPNLATMWHTLLTDFVTKIQQELAMPAANVALLKANIVKMSPYMSGLLVFASSAMIWFELMLARWWYVRNLNQNGRLKAELTQIRLGLVEIALLVLICVGVLLHVPVAKDTIFILLLPFAIAGFSYLHYLQQRYRQFIFLLVVFYVSLFLTTFGMVSLLIAATIGFVDSVANLRKYLTH